MDKKIKQYCPTCGQPMDFIKSEKKPINRSDSIKSKEHKSESDTDYSIYEIWDCLNCSLSWQKEIYNNIWRKNPINEE
jgi:hypothetical protein